MDKEKLKKSNELDKQIEVFEKHVLVVKKIKEENAISKFRLITSSNSISDENLVNSLLPISIEDCVNLYISKAEAKLAEMKKEFENL